MSDELKSAWEIALEKLESEAGPVQKLSTEQREEIAEVRRIYQARIAEKEISIESEIRTAVHAGDLDRIGSLKEQLAKEKQALSLECEQKVEEIRQQAS